MDPDIIASDELRAPLGSAVGGLLALSAPPA